MEADRAGWLKRLRRTFRFLLPISGEAIVLDFAQPRRRASMPLARRCRISNRVRCALGVTATSRLRVLPDIPLIDDVVPGYTVTGWLGFGVPKGTPAKIVERLNREVNGAIADPAVKARMAELGSETFTGRRLRQASPRKPRSRQRWSSLPASRRSRGDPLPLLHNVPLH